MGLQGIIVRLQVQSSVVEWAGFKEAGASGNTMEV